MKVFNWVHRRFLNVQSCTTFLPENGAEKGGSSKIENEKHVLLERDAHMVVEMIDHWKDGILSIGTLAISPLEATKYGLVEEDDDDDGHDEHDQEITHVHDEVVINDFADNDEASPLMNVEFFSHELEKVIGANHEITEEEEVAKNVVVELKDKYCGANEIDEEHTYKRRVTLADLFMEDSDYHHPDVYVNVLKPEFGCDDDEDFVKKNIVKGKQGIEMMMMKPTSKAKHRLSKAKKLLKEDLHPLKKFNKLMKRMMKKKIHPDLEEKMQKDMQMNPSYGVSNPTNDHYASNHELASLLLIQDTMV